MRENLKLSRKDFCITVSLTGYRIKYKGVEIGGFGCTGWQSALRGHKATKERLFNAICGDIEVSHLINGNGCKTQLCKIREIENKLKMA